MDETETEEDALQTAIGIGFQGNPTATWLLGAAVILVSFGLAYWRYRLEKKSPDGSPDYQEEPR